MPRHLIWVVANTMPQVIDAAVYIASIIRFIVLNSGACHTQHSVCPQKLNVVHHAFRSTASWRIYRKKFV